MSAKTNEFSSDELNPPEWLNKIFFETAIKHYKKDESIKVHTVKLQPGTKPGEHYASIMFRAEITFDSEQNKTKNNIIKLILKTVPFVEGAKLDLLKNSSAFKTEMRMYEEILPEMERLLASIGDKIKICPTLVYQSNDPAPVVVFIDEGDNNFKTYDKPLNLEKLKIVTSTIAKFHATSVFMNENGFDMIKIGDNAYEKVEGKYDPLLDLFMPNVERGINDIKTWNDCEKLAEMLENNLKVFEERIREIFLNEEKRKISVLIHGDYHYKNMMYRNEGIRAEDYILLDYQFCMWTTPANDILLLLNSIGDNDIRTNHRNTVIKMYHQVFEETLLKLGFKNEIPRLLDLQMELFRCSLLEYMFLMVFLAFQYINWDDFDLSEMMDTKNLHSVTKSAWSNKEFCNFLINMIKNFAELGTFE